MAKFKEVELSENLIDTKSWLTDEEIMNIFFEDYDPYREDKKISDLNSLLLDNSTTTNNLSVVNDRVIPLQVQEVEKSKEEMLSADSLEYRVTSVYSPKENNEIVKPNKILKAA